MIDTETSPTAPAAENNPALRCQRGAPAPPGMGPDLCKLLALSPPAQKDFWIVLRAYLRPSLDDEAERAITAYCEEHQVEPAQLAPPVKATRHLFREAARHDADNEDFAADVMQLVDIEDAQELLNLMLPWFEDLQPQLRRELVRQTVADHGKLVVDTRWRLEHITSSDRVSGIDTTVAVMTFSYVDGDEQRRTTLHFLPDQIAALRQAASEMLG
jgi:hypothetical protein